MPLGQLKFQTDTLPTQEILAIVKRPLFRCKSGEGTNPYRVFWRRMDSCNLPARDGQLSATLAQLKGDT